MWIPFPRVSHERSNNVDSCILVLCGAEHLLDECPNVCGLYEHNRRVVTDVEDGSP